MKKIELTRGKVAIIDDQDYGLVSQYKWRYGFGGDGGEYAVYGNGKESPTIRMHRLIMGAVKGQEVDHINGNGLDNRRENLRFVNRQQNNANRRMRKDNKTGAVGIRQIKSGKWEAYIKVNKVQKVIGYYDNMADAVIARERALREVFGEYAPTKKL